ncbi:MAG: hypothetical protein ACRDYA_24555, partial [Egibacteraceae bacterium]
MDRYRDRQGGGKNRRKPRPCWRGDELRALRGQAGAVLRDDGRVLSQFQLAEQIKASDRAVRTWEADDCILVQPALIENLDAFAARVGFRRTGTKDDMNRGMFVAGGAAFGMARLLPAPSRAVDEGYVAGLAGETTGLEARFDQADVVQLMDSAVGHYEKSVSLLDYTSTDGAHRQLQVVAGATALLVGILAREVGLWAWSRQYAGSALDLAVEAGDRGLEARAHSDLGFLYHPSLGDGAHADVRRCVEQAERAYRLAQRFSPPAMRSYASAQLGIAYAIDKQRVQARSALSQAGKDLGGDGAADDLGARFVGTMDETTVAWFTGEGLLALGDVEPAIRGLEDALSSAMPPRDVVDALAALAGAYRHTGDRPREASLLAQARAVATKHRYLRGLQRIEA